ncbi:MAG: hypothetical protein HC836_39430 [Richelia sp. RM2_1_2]|nr:hypothetical protein [Richelia sp. RM2_1_2]
MKIKTCEYIGEDYYRDTICHTNIIVRDNTNLWDEPNVEGEVLHYGFTPPAMEKFQRLIRPMLIFFQRYESMTPTVTLVYEHTDDFDNNYAIVEYDFDGYPNSNFLRKEVIDAIRSCSNLDPLESHAVTYAHNMNRTWQN